MMRFDEIHNDLELLNDIDWDMGPEDAVTMHLEWGNNPVIRKKNFRSTGEYSTYFVVNTWREPIIYLIRRNADNMEELAEFRMPQDMESRFMDSVGHNKGVYAIEGEVKEWLQSKVNEA